MTTPRLNALKSHYDCVVIGAGAAGASVALHLALAGQDALLIDASDYGSRTSAWSSKLIHGGLRYLELLDFALVRESLRERAFLLEKCPHLVQPLRFSVPVFPNAQRPRWKVGLGVKIYDLLAGKHRIHPSESWLDRTRLNPSEQIPIKKNCLGGASYWDALTQDSSLVLSFVLQARALGATCINHTACTGQTYDGNVHTLDLRDQIQKTQSQVTASKVIACTGPYAPLLAQTLNAKGPPVRLTKGAHLVLDIPTDVNTSAALLQSPDDGRVLFTIPWMGKLLLGTTDTDVSKDLHNAGITLNDAEYLMRAFLHHFDVAKPTILSGFSGVRVLQASEGSASSVKREHVAWTDPKRQIHFLLGGKLTGLRQLGAEAVGHLLDAPPLSSDSAMYPSQFVSSPTMAAPNQASDLPEDPDRWFALLLEQGALTLEDMFATRTRWNLLDPQQTLTWLPLAKTFLIKHAHRTQADMDEEERLMRQKVKHFQNLQSIV